MICWTTTPDLLPQRNEMGMEALTDAIQNLIDKSRNCKGYAVSTQTLRSMEALLMRLTNPIHLAEDGPKLEKLMSDSGRVIGECHHGRNKVSCPLCAMDQLHRQGQQQSMERMDRYTRVMDAILDAHKQIGDDTCWMDIDKIFIAAGLPVPDRTVGDKKAMKANCDRYIELLCKGGGWKTYQELEQQCSRYKDALLEIVKHSVCCDARVTATKALKED